MPAFIKVQNITLAAECIAATVHFAFREYSNKVEPGFVRVYFAGSNATLDVTDPVGSQIEKAWQEACHLAGWSELEPNKSPAKESCDVRR